MRITCEHFPQCSLLSKVAYTFIPFQVKELGVLGMDCECLAQDADQLFAVYWNLSTPDAHIPHPWPPSYDAMFNLSHPADIKINGTPALAYWSVSDPFDT